MHYEEVKRSCLAANSIACSRERRERLSGWFADTFHKPGFKMHTKILHHLFQIISTDVIKAPLWDVAALGPTAFPNNAAFVHQHVSQLLATSFPNLRPQQVEVAVLPSLPSGLFCQELCEGCHEAPPSLASLVSRRDGEECTEGSSAPQRPSWFGSAGF
jgi:hypothetical protein